jgi:molecular chaperone Hsp33
MKNVLRALVYDGQVSLTLIDTTQIVAEGIKLHNLSPASGYVFGKALSAMSFMSACLKEDSGEISLSLKTDGACGEIAVSGNRALRMRGYILNTEMAGDVGVQAEQTALGGNGSLTIIRDDGYSRPFVGACALPEKGGIDQAFEEYYRISEQLPTYIATEVKMDGNACVFAGAAVLQPLPFADEATLQKVRAFDLKALLAELEASDVEQTASAHFEKQESVWETRRAVYKCNCSRRYLTRVLVSLGEEQLRAIIKEEGAARIHCHYCNTDYEFNDKDADELFSR